jgi:DNA-binding CsgD family transcriptional regulator
LAHDRNLSEDETQGLLESLNVESSVTISHNVAYMMRQQEMDYEKMRTRLPELTPSELEIARLILQEKKLNAIVKLTGKTRGNITVQRSKIRKKLRLPKNVSLYDGLRERMRSES